MNPRGRNTKTAALLFATVGGNSGLLTTLAWALSEQRGVRLVEWHTVLLPRGADYMQADVLDPGAALDRLHALAGPDTLPRDGIRQTVYREKRAGLDLPAARDEQRYVDTVLRAGRAALVAAGEHPLVFALVAGRDRVMTLALTLVAQFLARPTDLILDLRVDPPARVVNGGYYLPEPRDRARGRRHAPAGNQERVRVQLVDVPLPRLAGLLGGAQPDTYAQVLQRGQRAVEDAAPVELLIDLRETWSPVRIAGEEVRFSPAEKLMLAALAEAQRDGGGFMRWPSEPNQAGHPLTDVVQRVPWVPVLTTSAILHFRGEPHEKAGFKNKATKDGKWPLMSRGLSQLGLRVGKKLEAHSEAHPELPRLKLAKQRVSVDDAGYWHVRLLGVHVVVVWPGDENTAAKKPQKEKR